MVAGLGFHSLAAAAGKLTVHEEQKNPEKNIIQKLDETSNIRQVQFHPEF